MLAGAALYFLLALRDWAIVGYRCGFDDDAGFIRAFDYGFAHLLRGADWDPVHALRDW